MSFPRAQVKRFNELGGCAPPPGHYNMPDVKQSTGVLPFETGGERFKQESDSSSDNVSDTSSQFSTTFLAPNLPTSKKKLNFSTSDLNKPKSAKSTPHSSPSVSNKEKQEYEKEIRRLLQQVNDQDKKICTKTQEIQKLQDRLSLITKDKSSLIAQVATAEKKTAELEKKSAILLSKKAIESDRLRKREDLEDELKKTKAKLETAKQELDKCRSLLVALQSDLQSARSTISALQQSNHVLSQLNKEVQAHSDDVSSQVSKLQNVADTLRAEKLSCEEELLLIKNKLKSVEKEFTSLLQEKVREIEKQFKAQQEVILKKMEQANTQLQKSQTKTNELQEVISVLESEKVHWIQEKKELLETLAGKTATMDQLSETIKDLKVSEESSTAKIQSLEDDKTGLQERVNNLETEIERVSAESREAQDNLEEALRLAREERDKAHASDDETKAVFNQLESEKLLLETTIRDLKVANQASLDELEKAMIQKEDGDREIESLKSALSSAETEKIAKEKDLTSLSARIAEEEIVNKNLRLELEQSWKEGNDLKERIVLLEAQADALETQLIRANENTSRALENEESSNQKVVRLEEQMKERETQYQAKLSEFTRRLLETQKKLNHKEEELQSLLHAKESDSTELRKLRKLLTERNAKVDDSDRLTEENVLLAEKVTKLQDEVSILKEAKQNQEELEELNGWKDRYNELWEKVEPFQTQIEAYAAEKSSLLTENSAAQAEMQALGKKYAELLGHQNQKQKIRHVVKIKEENLSLKQELTKLRSQVAKLQKQNLASTPRKFNPEDAFQHKKENATPLSHNN